MYVSIGLQTYCVVSFFNISPLREIIEVLFLIQISCYFSFKGIPTVSALVLVGDGIHNFVDGIALAAAFSGSLRTGLSTSIAILLHELPHEFGDFAIFIASGMGYKKALLLNLLSASMAFLGFFIGA